MGKRLFVALATILVSASAYSHHSASAFDLDRELEFQGTVVQYRWRNPHVYIVVRDENDIEWTVESDAIAVLSRSNWSRDSFEIGDSVSVRANPEKNAAKRHALLLSITGPDGVPMASMKRTGESIVPSVPATASSLAGIWTSDRTQTRSFRRAFNNHPLTEKGQLAKAEFKESMNPTAECIAFPTPFIMVLNSTYLMEVELREDEILLRSEFYDTTRTIYMDGRKHAQNGDRTNQGHSIGRWDEGTLVIDTTQFADHRSPAPGTGIPSGSEKHVVERLTLSEDRSQVIVSILMNDPEYLAEPIATEFVWSYAPDLAMDTVDCDPEVARYFLE
jgi:hypothetical protein